VKRAFLVGSAIVVLLVAAGCDSGPGGTPAVPASPAASWFAGCAAPTGGAVSGALPAVSLPCFTGGRPVPLNRGYGTPTVINLWASWCGPCRQELPEMQSYADRAAGKVTVLTVDVQDTRKAGLSFARDAGVRLPTLYDEEGALLHGIGRGSLPVTLLLDATGRLVHTYNAQALTVATLDALVRQYLNTTV
jgi:cytochrome c biogenesis protein CcmG/thiol:disulfide interchange protein DsbE